MSKRTRFVALLLLVGLFVPVQPLLLGEVSAEQAGDIVITSESITIDPTTPVDGTSATISVMLSNVGSNDLSGVPVTLYIDTEDPDGQIHSEFTSVLAGSTATIITDYTFVDSHLALTSGERVVIAYWQNGGEENWANKTIDVTPLPNLIISNITVSPTGELLAAQAFNVSTLISNTGGADAAAAHLSLSIAEFAIELATPVVPVGESRWVNTSLNAPVESGSLVVTVNSNSNDGVMESSMTDNSEQVEIPIITPPNYYHEGSVTVTDTIGSLEGPWTISGQVRRMGGEGDSSVVLSIQTDAGIGVRNLQLNFTTAEPLVDWSTEISTTNLGTSTPSTISLDVIIDAAEEVLQSTRFDDDAAVSITIHPIPNVVVSSLAAATPSEARPGEPVTFTVALQNVGSLAVSGILQATFVCGNPLPTSHLIPAPSDTHSGSIAVTYDVTACGDVAGKLSFSATWTADSTSHDSSTSDNTATGSVNLLTTLRLRFLADESWAPGLPIIIGGTYRYSISVTADEGAGNETFRCVDLISGKELGRETLVFSGPGSTEVVDCTFEAEIAGDLQLAIIPSGSTVATKSSLWSVNIDSGGPVVVPPSQARGIMVLMGSGILLLGVLVAAIILTRRTLADGERETYEMCPACDGEIEGDEETCPYCDFQLSGGYGRFHDCKECDGSIPSSMDHCPLCGAAQDITEFYEKREQKEIVEEDIEDIAEDDDEIVSGSLDFEERVKDFGVSDAALESDWDDRLGEAETELDDFADQRALSAVEAESEEGADQVATTHLKESIETDSRGIDDFLGEKGKRRSLSDAEVEFSASDASIRADLFEITGEVGVLPGQEVIAEEIIDPTIVNEELPTDAKSDFTSLDDDAGHTEGLAEAILAAEQAAEPLVTDQSKEEDLPKKRRSIRRRKNGDGGSGGNSARGDSANADNASNSAPSDDDSGAEDSAVEDSDAEDSGAQDSAVEDSDAEESPKSD